MPKILVSGLINIETTLKIDQFPLHYFPVTYPFHGIQSTVSGVGLNIAKELTILGSEVNFLSIIGNDLYEEIIRNELGGIGISDQFVLSTLKETAQSVILYDNSGRRQIHTDLKDIQQFDYPKHLYKQAFEESVVSILCNINFNRHLLKESAQDRIPIATDVHAIQDVEDDYNKEFMAAASILFLSHENLKEEPQIFIQKLWERYQNEIIVVGMGEQGAMLGLIQKNSIFRIPAIRLSPIVNTIGAGDALFSSFIFTFLKTNDPIIALQHAILFSSYKIGFNGAATGFISNTQLNQLFQQHRNLLDARRITI